MFVKNTQNHFFSYRSTSCIKFNSTRHGAFITYCFISIVCNNYLRNYWVRIILRKIALYVLQKW